jgi:fatty acid synthase subunit beta
MNQIQQSLRPLTLKEGSIEVSVLVSANIWGFAEQLKEEFPTIENTENLSEIELAASFLEFTSDRASKEQAYSPVAKALYVNFNNVYLKDNNIHAIIKDFPLNVKKSVIKSYYSSLAQLQKNGALSARDLEPTKSALFEAAKSGDAKLFAIFGGQGNIEEYFDELVDIWETYKGIVKPFICRMAIVLAGYAHCSESKVLHSKGLNIMHWLDNADVRPDNQYLISAPVSFPLIGLTQLLHYYVMLHVLGRNPAEIRDLLQGTFNKLNNL